ncbi:hydantoinase/oxoprolinase family protein [Paraburkholderia bannensis]|uniref:hydantoinase/oxoprolinase family protein n=1 Tax=Paraburkholderia bannensis TaxID=765414 RepID=UPI002AB7CBA6|nr:hydantoinase/oxoprolinase family protein [Paraburkholderia bannensis]
MTYRISVDTGGTFTDVVVSGGKHNLVIGKSLTTPERAFDGLSAAIENAASQMDMTFSDLIAQTSLFIYGTTRATNAIVTRQGAKTAFLTTEGFPDILVMKEGGKINPHDFTKDFPEPYIPRRRTFEVVERMTSEGEASTPLDEAQVRTLLRSLGEQKYEAIAVSLLWSIANPAHELRVGELIEEELPGVPYTLGHQLVPVLREYRRASATAIDASLKPLMQKHLRGLETDLREAGYKAELLVSTSMGGSMHIRELIDRPIHTAKSGPAMAPVAARSFSELEALGGDVIVADTGGTTFDVGLIRDGDLVHSRDTWLGGEWGGHLLGISSVDIRSVGAGGGSIAWIDDGGLLRVGPQSAGSVPGPACYGRGGKQPTVSDAACVLGYFNPKNFLGGRMKLDAEAARAAVATVADKLNRSVEDTAYGILTLASEVMINAVQDITIAEGINPRDSAIVAGGGAAGINIMLIAKELGCKTVLLPKQASALSASGMQFANVVTEETVSLFTTSSNFKSEDVLTRLEDMDASLDAFRRKLSDEHKAANYRIDYSVEARYASQVWEIETPIERDSVTNIAELVESFHRTHERLFAMRDEGSAIEFISWKARLVVDTGIKLDSAKLRSPSKGDAAVTERGCFFGGDVPVSTKIYTAAAVRPGLKMTGPCIIEEPTTTIVVFPGMTAEVTQNGHYLLTF